MMHLHGFGLSGRYLLPTAELLAGEFRTLVPDLPGAAAGRVSRSTCPSSPRPPRRSSTTGVSRR
jgi:pimeloyl-ACP methyl ester carboxylesterase